MIFVHGSYNIPEIPSEVWYVGTVRYILVLHLTARKKGFLLPQSLIASTIGQYIASYISELNYSLS